MSTCGTGYARLAALLCALALTAGVVLSACSSESDIGAAADPADSAEADAAPLARDQAAPPTTDAVRDAIVAQGLVDTPAADCAAQSLVKHLAPAELRAILRGRTADTGRDSPTGVSGLERKVGAASLICAPG